MKFTSKVIKSSLDLLRGNRALKYKRLLLCGIGALLKVCTSVPMAEKKNCIRI